MAGFADIAFYYSFGNGSSTGYYAVATWSNHTAAVGELIRQLTTPAVGSERCFICIIGGATGSSEPTWNVASRGQTTVSSSATYMECTGIAAMNGDAGNTPTWAQSKTALAAPSAGQVIKDGVGTHIFICTTGGNVGVSEPAWNVSVLGNTTADNGATWTYVGTASGTGTSFADWGSPHARLQGILGASWGDQPGANMFVADNSAETTSVTTTYSFQGNATQSNKLMCVDHTATTPPGLANLTTGASLANTGSGTAFNFTGNFYARGVAIKGAPTGAGDIHFGAGAGATEVLENCSIVLQSSSAVIKLNANPGITRLDWYNTTITFAGTGNSMDIGGAFNWYNTPSAISGTLPTSLFINTTTGGGIGPSNIFLSGVDLSNFTGAISNGACPYGLILLQDCKLNASATFGVQTGPSYQLFDYIRCSTSGTNNYSNARQRYAGQHTTDATVYRNGGASNGTTNFSWKVVTNANSNWFSNLPLQPLRIWNDVIGNVTVTIYGTWSGGSVPNNDQIWHELQYYASSSSPLCTLSTSGIDNKLVTASPQNTDSTSTWTNGSTTNFSMSSTVNMQQKGFIYVYIRAATASTTWWIDPAIVLT